MANLSKYRLVSKPYFYNRRTSIFDEVVIIVLLEYLLYKPALTLFEIATFLFDEFSITLALSIISKAIHKAS
jgi:hypothetical protein